MARQPRQSSLRRLLVALAAIVVGVIVLVFVALLLLPIIVSPDDVRNAAKDVLADTLGVPVEIEELDYHPLRGVSAASRSGRPTASPATSSRSTRCASSTT